MTYRTPLFGSRSLLVAALALPVCLRPIAAQEGANKAPAATAPATTAAPSGPVLVLKTSQPDLATMFAMRFGMTDAMPEAPEGGHYILSLGADEKIKVETGAGDAGLVDLWSDPGALMDMFGPAIEQVKPMVQGSLTMAMQSQGMSPKDVAALVKSIFEFPRQMSRLTLKVTGDPQDPTKDGIDVQLGMEPKAGTGMAGFVKALEPCSQGVPGLGGKGAIEAQFSMSPDCVRTLFAPMANWAISMQHKDEEQRKQASALMAKMVELYDGSMAMSLDEHMTGSVLVGMLDGEKLMALMSSDEYQAMLKDQNANSRDMEFEMTPGALEHRGTKFTKMTVTGKPNPMFPDGKMQSLFGAVGNYCLASFGGDGAAKSMVDSIADQKIKRAPLAGGAVMAMRLDMKALMAIARPGMDDLPPDAPQAVQLTFGKNDKGLALHIHVQ